jgi:outer membrane receptor protein involved in Fe transport
VVQPINPFKGEFGNLLAPRFNASYEVFKNFKVHCGYGMTSKAPTLLHLYPNPAYFDLVNFNYYALIPEERLIMVTTRVFDTQNNDLKVAKNIKKEIGLSYSLNKNRLSVTAFHDKLKGGYSFYNEVAFIPLEIYEAIEFPSGQPPILNPEPAAIETFIATYYKPMNTRETLNRGIEFDLTIGRISSIRTSFNLNGAYINTRMYSTDYEYWVNYFMLRSQRVAVFPEGAGTESTRFNTALRVIHNISELQFVVSLTIQTIWIERAKSIGYDYELINIGTVNERAIRIPFAYIQTNGDWVYLDRQEAMLPEYSDIRQGVGDANLRTLDYPPLWLFNIRLSKDIRESFGFAFYVNNMFMQRPIHYNQQTMKNVKRNPQIFFGMEMYIKI